MKTMLIVSIIQGLVALSWGVENYGPYWGFFGGLAEVSHSASLVLWLRIIYCASTGRL